MKPARTLGTGVSAWWLRAVIALTGGVVVIVPVVEATRPNLGMVLVGLAVLASVYAPASPAPAAVVIGGAVLVTLTGDDPLRPAVLVLIPTVHLFHVCCGLAGVLPVRGRLHPEALRGPALRVLAVQAVTFVLVGVAALLPTGPVPVVVEVAALVGVVVIALLVLLIRRDRRDHAHTRGDGRSTRESATMVAWGEGRPHGS